MKHTFYLLALATALGLAAPTTSDAAPPRDQRKVSQKSHHRHHGSAHPGRGKSSPVRRYAAPPAGGPTYRYAAPPTVPRLAPPPFRRHRHGLFGSFSGSEKRAQGWPLAPRAPIPRTGIRVSVRMDVAIEE